MYTPINFDFIRFINSPVHEVLKVNDCYRLMSIVRQQIVLKDNSFYIPRPIDSNLGRKYRGDL